MVAVAWAVASWVRTARISPHRQDTGPPVDVELMVDGRLSPDALWRAAGLPEGRGEVEEVRARLGKLPVVESVERQRTAGFGPVRFLVRERRPVALLICPASGVGVLGSETPMVLDRCGVAVPVASFPGREEEVKNLPKVHVLKLAGFAAGVPLSSPAVQTAVAVIRGANEGVLKSAVSEVRQMNDYSIAVDFEGGLTVHFAFDDPAGQMQKLRQIQSYAENVNRKLKTVNLVLRRNVPVTFAGETGEQRFLEEVQP